MNVEWIREQQVIRITGVPVDVDGTVCIDYICLTRPLLDGDAMAPYYNVNAHTFYQSCISADWDWHTKDDPLTKALAWVEAENTVEAWNLVQEWFEMMESRVADDQYPDIFWEDGNYPFLKPLTQTLADELIDEIDADFMLEKSRMETANKSAPEFSRLAPHARMAFAQAIYRTTLSNEEMSDKAQKLVEDKVQIPPKVDIA